MDLSPLFKLLNGNHISSTAGPILCVILSYRNWRKHVPCYPIGGNNKTLSWCVNDRLSFIYSTMAPLIIPYWNYCCMNLLRCAFSTQFPWHLSNYMLWSASIRYFISNMWLVNLFHIILNWFWILIQPAVHCLILSTCGCPKTGTFSWFLVFLLLFCMVLLFLIKNW